MQFPGYRLGQLRQIAERLTPRSGAPGPALLSDAVATLIYHLTCIANLPLILASGGLLCDADVRSLPTQPTRIGYADLKDRRMRSPVTAGPGGYVGEYVPFFFGPRPPMLYALWKGYVEGFEGDQSDVVHLVSTVEAVCERGLPFAFCDGHAVMSITNFYDDPSDLDVIDWPLMRARIWHDTEEDGDRKRRRQAEFLVHRSFPWDLVLGIGTMTKEARDRTVATLAAVEPCPPVRICRAWYYF